jgi:hypothetical protein
MFVGHLGAGLAVKAAEPRLNLGALFAAALFADLLLWTLVLAGVESVGAPVTSGGARFFTFDFPWSHGALASVAWTVAAAALGWAVAGAAMPRRARIAIALAAAVASHVLLDVIVHVPDVPLAGASSRKLGLGLWRSMPIALGVELALTAVALAWCLRARTWPRGRTALVVVVVVLAGALTIAGPYLAGEPPPASALAASSLATLVVVVALAFVADGRAGLLARDPGMP